MLPAGGLAERGGKPAAASSPDLQFPAQTCPHRAEMMNAGQGWVGGTEAEG